MTSFALVAWLISTFALGSVGMDWKYCKEAEQCIGETFMNELEWLSCEGANSCEGTTVYSNQGIYVNCDGFEACKGSDIIGSDMHIYAKGFDALVNATANVKDLICAGERSCHGGRFVAQYVYAWGAFSLADSVVICDAACHFYGYYAGYGASVECAKSISGSCEVTCSGSGCCGLSVAEGVDLTMMGDIADTQTLPSLDTSRYIECLPPQFPMTFVSDAIDEVYEIAEKFLAVEIVDYDDYHDGFVASPDFAYIACGAEESCYELSHGLVSGGLMCAGTMACYKVKAQNPSDASMLCLSEDGCNGLAVGPNVSEILCAGALSCRDAQLSVRAQKAIYCSGAESCKNTILTFNEDIDAPVVAMLGRDSAKGASVNCGVDRCAVYCDPNAKCETMTGPSIEFYDINVTQRVIVVGSTASTSTTGFPGSARSIEKEQDLGYDVIDSDDEAAEDSQDLSAVLAASLAFVAVVVIGVALFFALRAKDGKAEKEEKAVADEMIGEEDVPDASVEMVTEATITM